MPPSLWAEALHTATLLINIRPANANHLTTPHELLFGTPPSYSNIRVFGCLWYPNTTSTSANKLSPRSTKCVFLGYPSRHKGYRCLDLSTRHIIISRHVVFDEQTFPYAPTTPPLAPTPPEPFDPVPPIPPSAARQQNPPFSAAAAWQQNHDSSATTDNAAGSPPPSPPLSPSPPPSPPTPNTPPTPNNSPIIVSPPPQPIHRTRATTGRLPGPPDRLNLSAIATSPIPTIILPRCVILLGVMQCKRSTMP